MNSLLQSSVPAAIPSLCLLMLLQLLLLLQNWNCKTKILSLFKQIKHGCIQVNSRSGCLLGLSKFKMGPVLLRDVELGWLQHLAERSQEGIKGVGYS